MMEMPPLPKPENEADTDGCTYACPEGWSADQMRSYGESCARMAREDAAKLCDAQVELYGTKMAQALECGMDERWDRFHAYAEAVENIAAAIRKG